MYGLICLFFGGVLIFPISVFILKYILGKNTESKDSIGGQIVIETLPSMIAGFFFAFIMYSYNSDLVIAICTIAVGTHYFGFRSAYGEPVYWLLGIALTLLGFASLFVTQFNALHLLYSVSVVELIFGIILMRRTARSNADMS